MNVIIFLKKSNSANQVLLQTSSISEVHSYLNQDQSKNLFIRIENNQVIEIFSRDLFEKWQSTLGW